ncbi:MAG TPA: hypothetical protein DEP18_06445 [Flavobacteriales bacterium]|nr:hypothetical protein [Flavobacteriales bacterium]HRE75975.1 hypothetical protein [Flavobacteriales bacterium]HRE98704.1 hypothetical protein [Flavobacteriales bacterium]HRJ40116.1 hypothetical protein [Flavobacteriales bacterium]
MAATIKINMNTISNYYNNRKQILDQEIGETEKKINRITFLRLLLFSCALALGWYGIKNSDSLFVATSAFLFIAFIIAVIKHIKLSNDKDLLKRREKVVANEIVLLEGKASMLNNGSAHEEASSYAHDLDVFGEQSLFHRISRCYSPGGRAKLATILTEPPIENQQIKDRQSAIEELAEKTEFRELLLALMLKNDEDKSPESALYQWSENYSPTGNIKLLYILRIALPLLVTAGWLGTYFTGETNYGLWASGISLSVALVLIRQLQEAHAGLDGLKDQLKTYAQVWKLISEEKFESSATITIQNDLKEAEKAFRELTQISERFDRRLNPLVFVLLNATIAYDLFCATRLHEWAQQYRSRMASWFTATSQLEELSSFAAWNFNHPQFCTPELTTAREIHGIEIGHPFIAEKSRISNDFSIGKNESIILITGSNMSGKSTFLRSIGINSILAHCGTKVCARSFVFHPLQLLTSLRQSDSLHENVSLFHAELLRLKHIQNRISENGFSLVLIDEMLRGTNSEDKLNGSRQLILRLIKTNCIGCIATHDLELGELETSHPGKISNYCFESTIEGENLSFDYRLQKGIARNKNASFLLKKMNIIDGEP